MPEREKHDREQMNMIYNTIVSKGLAKEDQIVFVRGRGTELNSSAKIASCTASGFKMYCPSTQSATTQLGCMDGDLFSGLQPPQPAGLQPPQPAGGQLIRPAGGQLIRPATTTIAATVYSPSNRDNGMR
jgi:hypothetical protein